MINVTVDVSAFIDLVVELFSGAVEVIAVVLDLVVDAFCPAFHHAIRIVSVHVRAPLMRSVF